MAMSADACWVGHFCVGAFCSVEPCILLSNGLFVSNGCYNFNFINDPFQINAYTNKQLSNFIIEILLRIKNAFTIVKFLITHQITDKAYINRSNNTVACTYVCQT